jgi:alkylation response protein AidB-like acyl-CoA dehydrogenase
MDFQLSEEQKSLLALVTDFFKRETSPQFINECMKKDPKERIPRDLLRKMHAVGLSTLCVPARYGGGGVSSLLTQVLLAERAAQYGGLLCELLWLNWKLQRDLAAVGTKEQQDEFFPRIMEDPTFQLGETITEPEHGHDPRLPHDEPGSGLATFAHKDGDEYVINGEKCFTDGALTDLLFVSLRTGKNKPLSQSMSVILVPTNTPGFSVTRINALMSELIRPVGDLLFEDVRVPSRYLLGEENRGFDIMNGRYGFWLPLTAAAVGGAQATYELTKGWAKTRIQGGKPIFEHLTIGTRVVEMLLHIEQTRYLVYKTAWDYDQTGQALVSPLGFNLCNVAAKEMGVLVARHAAEVWGARGALKEMPIEGYIRGVHGHLHGFETASFNLVKAMNMI